MSTLVELNNICKSYQQGVRQTQVLNNINLTVEQGEMLAIMGPSGSGKSTLMNILGLLDIPDTGSYLFNRQESSKLTDDDKAILRNQQIGFVFQSFYLLPRLTAVENISLPLFYSGIDVKKSKVLALDMLGKVGMGRFAEQKPEQLSGGQQQRVAIARALINKPSLILADEPTGALDSKTGQEVMDLLITLNQQEKTTVIIITHDIKIAEQCERIVRIEDGYINA